MILERQKKMLSFLISCGGSMKNTDFMKLLFLYKKENQADNFYDFLPYKFGPCSFTAYEDRNTLIEKGFLLNGNDWTITQLGRKAASTVDLFMKNFYEKFKTLRGDELIKYVYKNFPEFAINSTIIDRISFGDEKLKNSIIEAKNKNRAKNPLSTIGYEGHTIESYFNKLIDSGVTALCDVRKNPISRKKGFSKSSLQKYCDSLGIKYFHIPELGIESSKRTSLKTQADYDALFLEYEKDILPYKGIFLNWLRDLILKSNEVIALTCFERLPSQCHRHCISDILCKKINIERALHL